jgi:hypothetical protein
MFRLTLRRLQRRVTRRPKSRVSFQVRNQTRIGVFKFSDPDYRASRLTVTALASVYGMSENGTIAPTRSMILKQQFPPKLRTNLPEYTMSKFTGLHYEKIPAANQETSMFVYIIV